MRSAKLLYKIMLASVNNAQIYSESIPLICMSLYRVQGAFLFSVPVLDVSILSHALTAGQLFPSRRNVTSSEPKKVFN